jgi:hypothetical protein
VDELSCHQRAESEDLEQLGKGDLVFRTAHVESVRERNSEAGGHDASLACYEKVLVVLLIARDGPCQVSHLSVIDEGCDRNAADLSVGNVEGVDGVDGLAGCKEVLVQLSCSLPYPAQLFETGGPDHADDAVVGADAESCAHDLS